MNVSLAAQLESPLLNSLQSSIVSKPFNYSLTENWPLLSKSNVGSQQEVPKIDFNADPNKFGPYKINQFFNEELAKQSKQFERTTLSNDTSKMVNIDN